MEQNKKALRIISYIAGLLALISTLMCVILLIMGAMGLFHPRVEKIVIETPTIEKVYDGVSVSGGDPMISFGRLHDGHELVVMTTGEYTQVGTHPNKATYMIVDASGTDVTEMYDIQEKFGEVVIHGRPITVHSPTKSRRYDGLPLVSDGITVLYGDLIEGHIFVCHATTQITDPGTQAIRPSYGIYDRAGAEVTHQYEITEELGELTVLPLEIRILTAGATKVYDGKPLTNNEWAVLDAPLLKGHTMTVECYSRPVEVGSYDNEVSVVVTDSQGADVSHFYEVTPICGTLQIDPIPLQISTGSLTKEYDGKPLVCEDWKLTAGKLLSGDRLVMIDTPVMDEVGTKANYIQFTVLDSNGQDVSHRYKIARTAGELTVTPRFITVRTGNATKPYDGQPLVCEEYQLIKGSLCAGEVPEISFVSITNIGYTPNYIIGFTIHKTDEKGNTVDVTKNYSITYDYGTLQVVAQ